MSHVFEGKHCRLEALVLTDQVPATVMYMLSVSSSPTLAMLSNFLDPSSLVCCMHFLPARTLSSVPAFPQSHARVRATRWTVPSSPSLVSMTSCSRISPHLWVSTLEIQHMKKKIVTPLCSNFPSSLCIFLKTSSLIA